MKWKKISEDNLPNEKEDVLLLENGICFVGYFLREKKYQYERKPYKIYWKYHNENKEEYEENSPTHWMHLPKLPEEYL